MSKSTPPGHKPLRLVEKRVPVLHLKTLQGDDAPGTYEAIFAVFGNEDVDGDVVEPGAFTESWAKELPKVVWSHDWLEVPIGVTLETQELDRAALDKLVSSGVPEGVTGGAWGKARLLVDTAAGEDHPEARKVWAALKAAGGDGRAALSEFSWGGRVLREEIEQRDNAFPLYHLLQIDQVEWGPCVKGANPATALIAVKALLTDGELTLEQAKKALGITDAQMPPVEPPEPPVAKLADDDWSTLRALLKMPADTGRADVLDALRASEPSSPPMGADPQQRARVAELLLS